MSVTARVSEPWLLDWFRPKTEYRILTDGNGVTTAWQKRRIWMLARRRQLYEITSFTPSTDDSESAFILATGPGATLTYNSMTKIFVCQEDSLELKDFLVGHYEQTQVWRWEEDWAAVPEDEFS